MSTMRGTAVHVLVAFGLRAVFVATPLPINGVAFVLWAILAARWVRRARTHGRRAGAAELVVQLAAMSVLVLAAGSAPVKTVDGVKARRVSLPKQAFTVAELQ